MLKLITNSPIAVAFAALSLNLAFYSGSIISKSSVPIVVYSLLFSAVVIILKFRGIKFRTGSLIIIVIFSIIPLVRIFCDAVSIWTPKAITDALFIMMPYYYLPIFAYAFVIVSAGHENILLSNLRRVVIFGALPACVYTGYIIRSGQAEQTVGLLYALIANIFVPISFLSVSRSGRSLVLAGWMSIVMIGAISALIGSRSYLLVSAIALIFSVLWSGSFGHRAGVGVRFLGRSLVCIATLVVAAILLPSNVGADIPVVEKLRLPELLDSINQAIAEGSATRMFYWSGNSRSIIIQDAFSDFDFAEWIFGRGTFGTYKSFVERHTIEVGWLQESFNWGVPYVLIVIGISLIALFKLTCQRQEASGTKNMYIMAIVLKLVDGFIYGMPEFSLYNFIYFAALCSSAVPRRRELTRRQKDNAGFASA